MSREDRRYLKILKKMTPSSEVFKEMMRLLANIQAKTDQMFQRSSPKLKKA